MNLDLENSPGHSTGPRTPEGKAISSQNACKHHLFARTFYIPPDLQSDYQDLVATMLEELKPQGALEEEVFRLLVENSFNRRRVQFLISDLSTDGKDPLADPETAKAYDRYARHEARFERAFYKAVRELATLQTNRALRDQTSPAITHEAPPLTQIDKLTKRTPLSRRPPDQTDYFIMETELECAKMRNRALADILEKAGQSGDMVK